MKGMIALSVLSVMALFVGCSDKSTDPGPVSTKGTMAVRMVDAPAVAFEAVNIVVDSVQVHVDGSSEAEGWTTISTGTRTYNLLTLVNGASALLGEAELEAGLYSQMRLFIGAGSNVVVNGVPIPLEVSSGAQSGLKLNIHAELRADTRYELYLDFDAARSIVVNATKYILKPVIRVATAATTGVIAGAVLQTDASATVYAYSSTDTASTVTNSDGAFKLMFLPPGSYSVLVSSANTLAYRDTVITNVSVSASQTTNLGVIQLSNR